MATTWIKPTYAHKRYHSKTTIRRKVDYIIDRQKTSINSHDIFEDMQDEDIMLSVQTNLAAVSAISDYAQNPAKTKDNELVTGYECFPELAADQFAAAIDMYEKRTGRKQKPNSRLVYHMRQAFKPGEVDPRVWEPVKISDRKLR